MLTLWFSITFSPHVKYDTNIIKEKELLVKTLNNYTRYASFIKSAYAPFPPFDEASPYGKTFLLKCKNGY